MWSEKLKHIKMKDGDLEDWYDSFEYACKEVASGLRSLYESYYGFDPEYILRDWLSVEAYAWMCYHGKHPTVYNEEFINRMYQFRGFLLQYLSEVNFGVILDDYVEDHSNDKDTQVY